MDSAGRLQLGTVPDVSTSEGLVAVVSSPGTLSVLSVAAPSDDEALALTDDNRFLVCRGAILRGTTEADRTALATCFCVAGAVVVDGITVGDVQAGLANSRHARTLTALFRARFIGSEGTKPQTIILVVGGSVGEAEEEDLQGQVEELYAAVALEREEAPAFQDSYKLQVLSATSEEDSSKV